MPHLVGAARKFHLRGLALAARVEQAQLDRRRMRGEEGEVDAPAVEAGAEWEGLAVVD
jgi:hypothetical protein